MGNSMLRIPKNFSDKSLIKKFLPLISSHLDNVLKFECCGSKKEIITMREVYRFKSSNTDVFVLEIKRSYISINKKYYIIRDNEIKSTYNYHNVIHRVGRKVLDDNIFRIEFPLFTLKKIPSISDGNIKECSYIFDFIKSNSNLSIPFYNLVYGNTEVNWTINETFNFMATNTNSQFLRSNQLRSNQLTHLYPSITDPYIWFNNFRLIDVWDTNDILDTMLYSNDIYGASVRVEFIPINLDEETRIICIKANLANRPDGDRESFAIIPIKFESPDTYNEDKEITSEQKVLAINEIMSLMRESKKSLRGAINSIL